MTEARAAELAWAPASAFDLLEAVDDRGRATRWTRGRFGDMAAQVAGSWAVTVREVETGALVCVAGLWPEADHLEVWLAVGPAMRRRLRPALRVLGAHLERLGRAAGGEVRLHVRPGPAGDRVAGARLAAWSGFRRDGEAATPLGPVAVWRRSFVRDGD